MKRFTHASLITSNKYEKVIKFNLKINSYRKNLFFTTFEQILWFLNNSIPIKITNIYIRKRSKKELKICEICKKKIEKQELSNQVKISLGDFHKGKFTPKKTFYCHIGCII